MNFAWAFAGNFCNAFGQWLMLVSLAKITSAGEVGTFGLAMAISTPVIMLTNLQLRTVYVTDANEQYQYGHYLTLRLLSVVLALFLVLTIAVLSGYNRATAAFIVVWCLAQCVVSIKDSYMGISQRYERMDKVSLSRILQSLFSVFFFVVVLYYSKSLIAGAIALILVRTAILYFFDILTAAKVLRVNGLNSRDYLKPSLDFRSVGKLLCMTVPLGIVMALTSLSNNVPKYFIEHYWGKEQLGYFTAVASFIVAGNLVVAALAQSAAPRLANYYSNNVQAYGKLLMKMAGVGLAVGLIGVGLAWGLGPWILSIFFKPKYAEYNEVFVWLMVSTIPYYISSFLNNGLVIARKLNIQMPLNAAAVLAVLLCGWLWIPSYGQLGAAWSMTGMMTLHMIGIVILNRNAYHQRLKAIQAEPTYA
jgi:O-antigen/teichoic acid export membrane protein